MLYDEDYSSFFQASFLLLHIIKMHLKSKLLFNIFIFLKVVSGVLRKNYETVIFEGMPKKLISALNLSEIFCIIIKKL